MNVLITGANAGLGYETARQLASVDNLTKIILACRNEEKAEAAKKSLEESTGKSDGFYEILIIDVSSVESVRKAVDSLNDNVHSLILNAGGVGGKTPAATTADGVTSIFGVNVLGHVLLVDLLAEGGRFSSGGTVIFAGTEAARGVPKMGFPVPVLKDGSVDEMTGIIDGSRFSKKKQNSNAMYGITKLVGILWMGAMARKYPEVRFVTMSPGMTGGTNAAKEQPAVQKFFFKVLFPVMGKVGMAHGVEVGARRYVDAMIDGDTYKTGRFYASKKNVSGEVADQECFTDMFYKEDYQDNSNTAIHNFLKT